MCCVNLYDIIEGRQLDDYSCSWAGGCRIQVLATLNVAPGVPRISLVTAGGCPFQDRKCTWLRFILNIHNILDMEDMEDILDTQDIWDIQDTMDIQDTPWVPPSVESWVLRCLLEQSLSKLILQTGPWLWECWQLPLVPEWLMTCWQMCQKPLLQKLHDCSSQFLASCVKASFGWVKCDKRDVSLKELQDSSTTEPTCHILPLLLSWFSFRHVFWIFLCVVHLQLQVFHSKLHTIPQGTCPPMLRSNVVARGPHLPLWQGVTPHAVLRDWFDDEELSPGLSTTFLVVLWLYLCIWDDPSQKNAENVATLLWHVSIKWRDEILKTIENKKKKHFYMCFHNVGAFNVPRKSFFSLKAVPILEKSLHGFPTSPSSLEIPPCWWSSISTGSVYTPVSRYGKPLRQQQLPVSVTSWPCSPEWLSWRQFFFFSGRIEKI